MAQHTAYTQRNVPSEHTSDQEQSGPGHRTRNATREASTPVSRNEVAQDTAHATQRAEQAHQ